MVSLDDFNPFNSPGSGGNTVLSGADQAVDWVGNQIAPGDPIASKFNKTYPEHALGESGTRLNAGEVALIAQWAELPAALFTQIARGESDYYPGVVSSDGGYGLWQMTPRVWGPDAVGKMNQLGGVKEMLNPMKNAIMARYLYDSARGHSPWYGTKFVTGSTAFAPSGHGSAEQTFQYLKKKLGDSGPGIDIPNPLDAAGDMIDFVGDFVTTLLNFRKLGELAAKAVAWFIRLIAKAIWDYVIQPIHAWNQRAITYYWDHFFSGDKRFTREDSVYFANGGIVTLTFWALGYGVLWTRVEPNLKFRANPRETMLGRFVRSTSGQVARKDVTKAKNVQKETPTKPKPVTSKAVIKRTREFSTYRQRPVRVTGTDRSKNGSSNGQRENRTGRTGSGRVPRPGSAAAAKPVEVK